MMQWYVSISGPGELIPGALFRARDILSEEMSQSSLLRIGCRVRVGRSSKKALTWCSKGSVLCIEGQKRDLYRNQLLL